MFAAEAVFVCMCFSTLVSRRFLRLGGFRSCFNFHQYFGGMVRKVFCFCLEDPPEDVEVDKKKKQKAIVDKKLALEMVHTTVNPADVRAKALLGDEIRELCRLVFVFPCHSEDATRVDLGNQSLSQLDGSSCGGELCHQKCFAQPHEAELFCSQSHLVDAHSDRHRLDVTSHSSHSATAKR